MKRVPDKCPFCKSPIMAHVGNLLVSENGEFATYECKTMQDVRLNNHWKRVNQSDGCRRREIELLTMQCDAANKRIKRLEAFVNRFLDPEDLGYAVNKCLRDDAREALGRSRVESPIKENKS